MTRALLAATYATGTGAIVGGLLSSAFGADRWVGLLLALAITASLLIVVRQTHRPLDEGWRFFVVVATAGSAASVVSLLLEPQPVLVRWLPFLLTGTVLYVGCVLLSLHLPRKEDEEPL